MISPLELRIGNVFYGTPTIKGHPVLLTAAAITQNGVFVTGIEAQISKQGIEVGPKINLKDLQPFDSLWGVPLNSNVLEKIGFRHDGHRYVKSNGRLSVQSLPTFDQNELLHVVTSVELNVGLGFVELIANPPQALHEIQNLWRALSGEDLELIL